MGAEPVLSLAIDNISKIDTVDCERLSSLWTVFTKCAENLENGRRLENLSWRLWYRECQLLERDRVSTISKHPSSEVPQQHATKPPSLSNSVESFVSEVEVEVDQRSHSPSPARRCSKGQHLTPNRFHELVTQFGQHQAHYGLDQRDDLRDAATEMTNKKRLIVDSTTNVEPQAITSAPAQDDDDDDDDDGNLDRSPVSTLISQKRQAPAGAQSAPQNIRRASSVVHGFHPEHVSVRQPSVIAFNRSTHDAGQNKHMFFFESSPSETDVEEESRPKRSSTITKSQRTSSSKSVQPSAIKKHTSFRDIVDEGSEYDSSPFDSDSEDEGVTHVRSRNHGESAILSDDDDDDESGGDDADWHSICSESRPSSPSNGNLFNKVNGTEPRPGLTSCKSILSTLLTNPMTRVSNNCSKSSPAIAQSRLPSPIGTPPERLSKVNERESGISTPTSTKAAPIKGSVSPRTTRRNMMATELSESLRRHLLWERKQKSIVTAMTTNQAVLQRRHTALDFSKVQRFPTAGNSWEGAQRTDVLTENEFGYNGAGW